MSPTSVTRSRRSWIKVIGWLALVVRMAPAAIPGAARLPLPHPAALEQVQQFLEISGIRASMVRVSPLTG